jgi:hypothetical protein
MVGKFRGRDVTRLLNYQWIPGGGQSSVSSNGVFQTITANLGTFINLVVTGASNLNTLVVTGLTTLGSLVANTTILGDTSVSSLVIGNGSLALTTLTSQFVDCVTLNGSGTGGHQCTFADALVSGTLTSNTTTVNGAATFGSSATFNSTVIIGPSNSGAGYFGVLTVPTISTQNVVHHSQALSFDCSGVTIAPPWPALQFSQNGTDIALVAYSSGVPYAVLDFGLYGSSSIVYPLSLSSTLLQSSVAFSSPSATISTISTITVTADNLNAPGSTNLAINSTSGDINVTAVNTNHVASNNHYFKIGSTIQMQMDSTGQVTFQKNITAPTYTMNNAGYSNPTNTIGWTVSYTGSGSSTSIGTSVVNLWSQSMQPGSYLAFVNYSVGYTAGNPIVLTAQFGDSASDASPEFSSIRTSNVLSAMASNSLTLSHSTSFNITGGITTTIYFNLWCSLYPAGHALANVAGSGVTVNIVRLA